MSLFLKRFLLAGLLLAVAVPAVADQIVLDHPDTIEDAWRYWGGGASSMQLNNGVPSTPGGTSYTKYIYLRFDLSAIPAGSTVDSAIYHVKGFSQEPSDVTMATIGLYYITKPWVEAEMSWANYATGQAWDTAGGDYEATPAVTFDLSAGTGGIWRDIDITAMVQAWVNGKANDGILLKYVTLSPTATDRYAMQFYSSEAAVTPGYAHVIPTVTVNYTPEPATMSLLGLGGLSLLIRRKRK